MAEPQTVCFVSGASRGLGLALVQELATRYPNPVVYAGVRDPGNAPALQTLAAAQTGKIHPVKWAAGDVQANEAVAQLIRERHGHVDVVVANAAVAKSTHSPASETPIEDFREMLEVNTTGVLLLFQSLFPLLKASTHHPGGAKFVAMSSGAGSITGPWVESQGVLAGYGASKAAMNYLCRKIHFENEWLTCFPMSPGVVATDMLEQYRTADTSGEVSRRLGGMSKTPEDTARMVLDVIDVATRETHGGEFVSYNGSKVAW